MKKRWLFARLGVVGALIAGSLVFVLAPPAQSIEASLVGDRQSDLADQRQCAGHRRRGR